VNLLDLLIILLAVSAGIAAWRLGFVARAASWIGMAAGVYVAGRTLPSVLDRFESASETQTFLAVIALLIAGGFLGQALGLVVGGRLRVAIPEGNARTVDKVIGAMAGVLGVLVLLWLTLPTMANVPGWPAEQARNSSVARALNAVLPEPPDTFATLDEFIGDDRFPSVFDALRPSPDLGNPPRRTGIPPTLSEQVAQSTVRIEGEACGRLQEGSGFVVDTDLVVTNAHVVSGDETIEVVRTDGSRAGATVVTFDPDRDLALLEVPGLDRPALPMGEADEGDRGGVYGYPGGGDLRIAPYEIAREVEARGTDIYDDDQTVRSVYFLSAHLRPGDSGSALIDPTGSVVGVAFAIAPDRSNVAYALTGDELDEVLAEPRADAVDTGPCIG
jgi:S1-C subfamily serine protease